VGQEAVRRLADNQSGLMITLNRVSTSPYVCETGATPLESVANAEKLVPREFFDESGSLPNQKFVQYAFPLIGEALQPVARLQKHRVQQRV